MPLYVLDTDHLSLVQRADPKVSHKYFATPTLELAASVISYEEQVRGRLVRISQAKTPDIKCAAYTRLCQTQQFYCGLSLLEFDAASEKIFEVLRQTYRRLGRMDLQIAATALANNATLVTRNTQDFISIANLRLENWA